MLAGHAPFGGSTAQQIIAGHLTRTPEPIASVRSAVSPALGHLVTRCLEKAPADRVQSADEIVRLLDSVAVTMSAPTAVSATASGTAPARRSRRGLVVGGMLGLAAVAAIGVTLYTKQGRAGTLIGDDALAQNDMVLVAEFQNHTSDSTLAATITDAVRAELQQSRAVRVMSQQAMFAALTRMQLAHGTALPENTVHELAEREGAKAFICGRCREAGERLPDHGASGRERARAATPSRRARRPTTTES
jgi:hypothetical protein